MAVDAAVTIDVHNISAFENAFRSLAVHLDTRRLFADYLKERLTNEPLVVASPDPGGVKRAQLFRETLEAAIGKPVGFALMEKRRSAGVVSGEMIAGDVAGASVLIVDDLISTGGTMLRAASAFREAGAQKVLAVAAHGLFVGGARAALENPYIEKTFITDAVPPFRLPQDLMEKHLEVVSAAPLVADAIRRLHHNESIIELLDGAA
jgi:ribose-phosphate pyrophosphokinase